MPRWDLSDLYIEMDNDKLVTAVKRALARRAARAAEKEEGLSFDRAYTEMRDEFIRRITGEL